MSITPPPTPAVPIPPAAAPPAAAAATAAPAHAGVDVSKDALDLARSDDAAAAVERFANDVAGIAALVARLAATPPAVVVVESTGGFERPLVAALLDAGLPAAVVHPGRVRQFARGLGVLAKTDAVDARVLARFGRLAAPRLADRRSANEAELQALVVCRRQFTVTRTQQSNRLGATTSKEARKAIEAVIKALDKQVEKLDRQIRKRVDADDDFKHLDGLLQSVPGVGPVLSATLAAELRELGDADRRQAGGLRLSRPGRARVGGRPGGGRPLAVTPRPGQREHDDEQQPGPGSATRLDGTAASTGVPTRAGGGVDGVGARAGGGGGGRHGGAPVELLEPLDVRL